MEREVCMNKVHNFVGVIEKKRGQNGDTWESKEDDRSFTEIRI